MHELSPKEFAEKVRGRDIDPIFPLMRGDFYLLKGKTSYEVMNYLTTIKAETLQEGVEVTQGTPLDDDFSNYIKYDYKDVRHYEGLFKILARLEFNNQEEIRDYFEDIVGKSGIRVAKSQPKLHAEIMMLVEQALENVYNINIKDIHNEDRQDITSADL